MGSTSMAADYPNLWKRGLIQERVRDRAGHRCEECGMEFVPGTNLAVTERNRNGRPVVGTVHHIDENKQNCSQCNLVYLCQRCHLKAQGWLPGQYLPLRWSTAPAWIVARGIPYQVNPQLRLFEVEKS